MDDSLAAAVADLDDLVLLGLAEFLGRHSSWPQAGASAAQVADELKTHPRHRWVVAHWMRELDAHGISARPSQRELRAARRRYAPALVRLGYGSALGDLLVNSLQMLPELLTGAVDVQTLLYPDADVVTTEVAYRTNAVSRKLNEAAAAAAAQTARRAGRPVRVLELGAGIGTTAADLLPALSAAGAGIGEYRYTDLSLFFLQHGRERFGSFEGMRFEILDIDDIGPEPDGAAAERGSDGFDLVVAGTMAHNARDVDRLAAGVAARLAPGGRLLLIEPVREHAQSLTTMPFALSTATGAPERTDLRAGTTRTYLTREEWAGVLTRAGLRTESVLPEPGDPLSAFSQALFTATAQQRSTK